MPPSPEVVQRRTLRVLSGMQILVGLGAGANVAAGGLIAADVAGTESAAGLAQTSTVLGAALAAVPLASLTSDRGRRRGLVAGLLVGGAGSTFVVLGAQHGVLAIVLLGTLLAGASSASALQARFAATDLARPEAAASALSIVVWATTVGAVLGPNLTGPGARIGQTLGVPDLAGVYVISGVAFVAAAALVWVRLRPDPLLLSRAQHPADAPLVRGPRLAERMREAWAAVGTRSDARLGLIAVALGHAVMISVMVMTPVHMAHEQVGITVIGLVISVHVLGMYAFSPLVGIASDRAGRPAVLMAGALLMIASAVVVGTAPGARPSMMGAGLFLLGLGWSCTLIAGSALLSESVPAPSRQDVQGLSDMTMNAAGAFAGALAGGIVAFLSYGWLAGLAGVVVLPLAAGAQSARRRSAEPAP